MLAAKFAVCDWGCATFDQFWERLHLGQLLSAKKTAFLLYVGIGVVIDCPVDWPLLLASLIASQKALDRGHGRIGRRAPCGSYLPRPPLGLTERPNVNLSGELRTRIALAIFSITRGRPFSGRAEPERGLFSQDSGSPLRVNDSECAIGCRICVQCNSRERAP